MNLEEDFLDFIDNSFSTYFYRVHESITTMKIEMNSNEYFDWNVDFKDKDLLLARKKALAYYGNRRLKFATQGIDKEYFSQKYASLDKFEWDKNYAYSLNLIFMEFNPKLNMHLENFILGEDKQTIKKGQKGESSHFQSIGYPKNISKKLKDELYEEQIIFDAIRIMCIVNSEFKKLSLKEQLLYYAEIFKEDKKVNKFYNERAKLADL